MALGWVRNNLLEKISVNACAKVYVALSRIFLNSRDLEERVCFTSVWHGLSSFAVFLVFKKTIGKECSVTIGTGRQFFNLICFKRFIVVSCHLWISTLFTYDYLVEGLWRLCDWFSLVYRYLTLFLIKLFLTCLNVDLKTCRAKLSPANVAHQRLGLDCWEAWNVVFVLWLSLKAHLLVFHKWVWIEGAATPWTRHESLGVVVIKGCFIIAIEINCSSFGFSHSFIKAIRSLWTGSSLIFGFFLLFDLPLFSACLDVNL